MDNWVFDMVLDDIHERLDKKIALLEYLNKFEDPRLDKIKDELEDEIAHLQGVLIDGRFS